MNEFDYKEYFSFITPKTKMEKYNRFIFSFCSVHTTWQANIKGYELLKDKYHYDIEATKALIKKAGLGLTNNRARFIIEFTKDYDKNYRSFNKKMFESWQDYADRLQKRILGLGFAKARFAIEMLYPNTAQVVCVDTHIIQWARQNPNKMNKRLYHRIEEGWMNHSKKNGINPVESRWRWWDNKQGFDNPRYWSSVLENKNEKPMFLSQS